MFEISCNGTHENGLRVRLRRREYVKLTKKKEKKQLATCRFCKKVGILFFGASASPRISVSTEAAKMRSTNFES